MNQTEGQIIEEIRQGKKGAFQFVFDTYYESMCQYAFTILRDMDEAEDIVQSIFIKIWERKHIIDIKQALRAYLFKSVYHRCMNLLEHRAIRQKHREDGKHEMKTQVQHPEIFPHELEDNVKSAINKLPPQCRKVFMLSRYEELRYAEIASKLGISVNTVENQISKALRILRSELKDIIV